MPLRATRVCAGREKRNLGYRISRRRPPDRHWCEDGDKTECRLYCGGAVPINGTQQQVGLNVHLLPHIRKDTIDLTAVFTFSEAVTNSAAMAADALHAGAISIQTNLDFAGRFQLPREMAGIFVLPGAPASPNQKHLGLLLTSNVLQPKK